MIRSARSLTLLLATIGYGVLLALASLLTVCRLNGTGCYQTIGFPYPLLIIPEIILIVGLVWSFSLDGTTAKDENLRQSA
jgi:hypothetical protein